MAIPEAVEAKLTTLPQGLREHVERTRVVGRELAERHDVDARAVDIAVAAHDLFRAAKGEELLSHAEGYGLEIDAVERQVPSLLHGPVAAEWLEANTGVIDSRIVEAVRCHTTGCLRMSSVAKAVFVADKIEPWKVEHDPGLQVVQEAANESLDGALLAYLDHLITDRIEQGDLVHPRSLELRNRLVTEG